MARTIEPSIEATRGHATQIASVGLQASHAGRDYQEHGTTLAAGVEGIVARLHSWSQASSTTVAALDHAVTTTVSADNRHHDQIAQVTGTLGKP
jgi:hypothetical protein